MILTVRLLRLKNIEKSLNVDIGGRRGIGHIMVLRIDTSRMDVTKTFTKLSIAYMIKE